jgi:mRNA interferase HigB
VIVVRRDIVDDYFGQHRGGKGIRVAKRQFDAWLAEVVAASWRSPTDVKARYATAFILKAGRVVFNVKGNDFRLVVQISYAAGVVEIRFFGSHTEYDRIDAGTI